MQRRQFTQALAAITAAGVFSAHAQKSLGHDRDGVQARLKALEKESGGRLGVAILDTASGAQYGHRSSERFPMCSTFKFLAAALVLKRVDAGQERLGRRLSVRAGDIITHSPATGPRVGADMSLAELCEATLTLSDNAAANLILASYGGPKAVTAYARSLGDRMTRLDRNEPTLNEATPGDARDTTTPASMLSNLHKIVLGNALSDTSREQMRQWLLANKTSDTRLRALMPSGWQVADKTGAGAHGTNNDIGILWPPGKAPLIVTVYLTDTRKPPEVRDAVIAKVGELVTTLV